MPDFIIIPEDEVIPRGKRTNPMSVALAEGKRIFIPLGLKPKGSFRQKKGYLGRRGMKVHEVKGIREGILGHWLWAENKEG